MLTICMKILIASAGVYSYVITFSCYHFMNYIQTIVVLSLRTVVLNTAALPC